jgi:16S rRNA G966 N2-methylase RsmD
MPTKRPPFRGLVLALGGALACACATARPPEPRPSGPPPEAAPRRAAADAELRNANRVYVAELGAELDVFPTVFRPRNKSGCLSAVQARPGDTVLDIGTGTGLIGLLTARQGARRVVATDINPAAVRNARHNARRLGYGDIFEAREVSMDDPGAFAVIAPDETFDLIVTDPPFRNFKPQKIREYALGDENYTLLRSILAGARDHLTESGRLLLFQGYREGISLTFELAEENGLQARIVCPQATREELLALPPQRFFIMLFEVSRKRTTAAPGSPGPSGARASRGRGPSPSGPGP